MLRGEDQTIFLKTYDKTGKAQKEEKKGASLVSSVLNLTTTMTTTTTTAITSKRKIITSLIKVLWIPVGVVGLWYHSREMVFPVCDSGTKNVTQRCLYLKRNLEVGSEGKWRWRRGKKFQWVLSYLVNRKSAISMKDKFSLCWSFYLWHLLMMIYWIWKLRMSQDFL